MISNFLIVFLQAAGKPNSMLMPLLLVGMIVVMYFFMIRPQQKKAKEQKKFAESIGTGDKVVTSSGIHGRITRTNEDNTIVLEIDRNTNITLERSAISMELTSAYQKRNGIPVSKENAALSK